MESHEKWVSKWYGCLLAKPISKSTKFWSISKNKDQRRTFLAYFAFSSTYFLRYWAFQVFWKLQGAWFKKNWKKPHAKAETFVTFWHFLFDQIPFYARGPWFKSPSHPSINAEIIWRKCISHIRNPRKSKFHYCWGVLQTPFTQTNTKNLRKSKIHYFALVDF